MAETTDPTCKICGGKRSEHGPDTIHAFTEVEGDLATPQQKSQQQQRPGNMVPNPSPPDSASAALGRLLGLMLEKDLVTLDETLYIGGFGPKPGGRN